MGETEYANIEQFRPFLEKQPFFILGLSFNNFFF